MKEPVRKELMIFITLLLQHYRIKCLLTKIPLNFNKFVTIKFVVK